MERAHVTLNIMSLGGLALGIGMLVDNSIVVLEAIDRRRSEGLDRARAAITGAGEVAGEQRADAFHRRLDAVRGDGEAGRHPMTAALDEQPFARRRRHGR